MMALSPHPIPPHEGEGGAFSARVVTGFRGGKVGLTFEGQAPPLPPVGRGWGWGADQP
jgi:hypothetical protein